MADETTEFRKAYEAEETPVCEIYDILSVGFLSQIGNHDLIIIRRKALISDDRIVSEPSLRQGSAQLYLKQIVFIFLLSYVVQA